MDEFGIQPNPWEKTALGPAERWPQPLQCWVRFISRSVAPTILFWGDDRLLIFNDAFASLAGPGSREALGKPLSHLRRDLAEVITGYVEDGFAGSSNTAEDVEFPIRDTGYEGSVFTFTYTPIFGQGPEETPLGVLCSVIDRTAKLASERRVARELQRLHELYEHAPGFIAMAEGPEHRFTFANSAYRELVGREDIIGKTVAVLPETGRTG